MEATLRFACLLAGLIAVQSQCLQSWTKVENSCYRAFGQMMTFDRASQTCKQFGDQRTAPGHLASPSSFEERRAVRKLRFDILRPIRGTTIGEGQRIRPANVWLGLRLGQGANTSWESTERYDSQLLNQHWGPNRPQMPGSPPQRQAFDPTAFRWNGRCMTLPGQMQMNGAIQKWGHLACNMQAAFICEISPPGIFDQNNANTGGFNASTGMGPGMPGQGGPGGRGQWGQGAQGGRGQWGQGGQAGRGQWGQAGQGGQGGWGQQTPGQGAGGRQWPNQGQGGAGQWPNNPQRPGAGAGGWPNNPQRPGQGAGGWPNNPQRPGQGGQWPNNPQRPGQGGAGRWNPQNPQRPFNPQQPRMYQQAQAIAMP